MSDVRLSVSIMAVPERKRLVEALCVAIHDEVGPLVTVAWDDHHRGVLWNSRQAWMKAFINGTHHIVLQDDAILCRDFMGVAAKAIEATPDAVVSFFNPRKAVLEAAEAGASWVRMSYPLWGQGLAMPVTRAAQFVAWSAKYIDPRYTSYDVSLGMFTVTAKIPAFCTVPNLVNHSDPKEVPSTLGHRPPVSRVSHCFLGNGDGSAIDWSKGLDRPIGIRYSSPFKHYRKWRKKNAEEDGQGRRCAPRSSGD